MALPAPYPLTRAGATRAAAAQSWLAPPLTAIVFLVHPLVAGRRPEWQLQDPGIGWHLATGRYILETGSIPSHDLFSFTASGHAWINYYWLFEVVAAWLERVGGLSLYATICMLVYAAVPVLLYRRMLRLGAAIVPALALTMLAQVVLMSHAVARPHVVTYLLFAFFLARLDDVRAGRRPAVALWVLPPLAALWCNLHGGFLAGLALAGLFAAVAVARALYAPDADTRRTAVVFSGTGAAILLATAANPHGFALHVDALRHLGMTTTAAFDEFRSPAFHAPTGPVLCFEILVLATLVAVASARRRLDALEVVLLGFFLHQALQSVRHINLFAIVAAPIVARELSAALAARAPAFAARWRAIAAEQAALRSPRLYFPAIVLGFVGLALAGASGFPDTLDDLQLSRGAAAYIAAHREEMARPFNTVNVGGALIHRFWPDVRVFADDRISVYGDAFVADEYLAVHWARHDWREVLARHDVEAAVVDAAAPVATLLRAAPDWQVAYEDEQTVILRRAESTR